MQVLFQVQLENDLFTLFEKKTRYSLLSVLIISFLAFYFQLQILFYLLVQTYHEILHTSNHSESEIKFEVLTDAPLGVILYHDVVLNKQISISQSLKSF